MVSSGVFRAAAKLAGSQRPLRSVEVKSAARADEPTLTLDVFPKQPPNLDPVPAVVVPLPRRPLFPGYMTCAYMKNQPTLARSLTGIGDIKVAAFMLKDTGDYRGCVLRPGLRGQELLKRLYSVGTLAMIHRKAGDPETGRMCLSGHQRVRMTGTVVEDDPFTVMVQPLVDEEEHGNTWLGRLMDDNSSAVEAIGREAVKVFNPYGDTFRLIKTLSAEDIFDPNGQVGWYLNKWCGNIGYLADIGPAVMPVLNRCQHQRALEEQNRSKRLEHSIELLKRELEFDNLTRQFDMDEDGLSYEEKELLAKLRGREEKIFVPREMDAVLGQLLMAPSVQMRVRISTHRSLLPRLHLKECMDMLKQRRMTEHLVGY